MKKIILSIVAICVGLSSEASDVFEIKNPNYQLSPYTGLTRQHWVDAATHMLGGAFGYINSLDDQMYFPKQLEKTYPRSEEQVPVAKLEGLARTFFLAAPLLRDNPDLELNGIKVADYYRHQIKGLTDSTSVSYIPHRTGGPSQTLLELGSICLSLKLCQPVIWDTFLPQEKDALAELFLSYGQGPSIGSNWQFFNVFVMSFCKDQGYEIDEALMRKYLENLLALYRGQGWYNDAPAYDYYSMWAFQTYGPLLALLYGKEQYPDLAQQFLANQKDMVDNYPYMFARDGRMNMWGRSLPYRFAAVAPFALVERDGLDGVDFGWLRHISSASLLQFMDNPYFMEDGVPTMGFYGPFAPAVQIYSCRGSVYWIGKAFFNLLLPADSKYWTAVENEGPWKDMSADSVYNRFQPGTNLMITDYPRCGGAEMRSWCHEKVADDWQLFRSSENYNKLAYHTEFPWMADGDNGEVSMNYATLTPSGKWEVLRLYDFLDFTDGVYSRKAELETEPEVKFVINEQPLPDGVMHNDEVTLPFPTKVRLGSYSLPDIGKGFRTERTTGPDGIERVSISNGEYRLTVTPIDGWSSATVLMPRGLHPLSETCAVIITEAELPAGSHAVRTLHTWEKIE